MKYLIAIDSDGTLCHTDGTISAATKEVIRKHIDIGNFVVVCTARPRYHTLKIADEIKSSRYVISSNGSEIYDSYNNKVIWGSYIDYDVCVKVYEYASLKNVRVMYVIDDTEYVTLYTRNDNQRKLDDENYSSILKGNVKQIMVVGSDKEKIKLFRDMIYQYYDLSIVDYSDSSLESWFSVINKQASKGNAVVQLAKYLDVSENNIIAIGNDMNDISMLEVASVGVVVDNALDEVKKYASVITLSNDFDGVADYLNKILE